MRLFDFYKDRDYGEDFYFTLGQFKRFNVPDVEIHTSEYWSWSPHMRLTLGVLCGSIFSIDFSIWSFAFGMEFISYGAPWNLSHTREL